eukprot:CAMPEP_0184546500 /NCGR_PEP_ID=MMETSP0199_2-20130426/4990_1 /TAXON_ID=1112570 /ORGANISM="Thraustochytrium sp., Strain LLF1b" /LENGTH=808 /DNA_ID=CAMNT_0026940911 /DNA_START=164 /DNA_END=2590 /DNA_ORIENTATION=+
MDNDGFQRATEQQMPEWISENSCGSTEDEPGHSNATGELERHFLPILTAWADDRECGGLHSSLGFEVQVRVDNAPQVIGTGTLALENDGWFCWDGCFQNRDAHDNLDGTSQRMFYSSESAPWRGRFRTSDVTHVAKISSSTLQVEMENPDLLRLAFKFSFQGNEREEDATSFLHWLGGSDAPGQVLPEDEPEQDRVENSLPCSSGQRNGTSDLMLGFFDDDDEDEEEQRYNRRASLSFEPLDDLLAEDSGDEKEASVSSAEEETSFPTADSMNKKHQYSFGTPQNETKGISSPSRSPLETLSTSTRDQRQPWMATPSVSLEENTAQREHSLSLSSPQHKSNEVTGRAGETSSRLLTSLAASNSPGSSLPPPTAHSHLVDIHSRAETSSHLKSKLPSSSVASVVTPPRNLSFAQQSDVSPEEHAAASELHSHIQTPSEASDHGERNEGPVLRKTPSSKCSSVETDCDAELRARIRQMVQNPERHGESASDWVQTHYQYDVSLAQTPSKARLLNSPPRELGPSRKLLKQLKPVVKTMSSRADQELKLCESATQVKLKSKSGRKIYLDMHTDHVIPPAEYARRYLDFVTKGKTFTGNSTKVDGGEQVYKAQSRQQEEPKKHSKNRGGDSGNEQEDDKENVDKDGNCSPVPRSAIIKQQAYSPAEASPMAESKQQPNRQLAEQHRLELEVAEREMHQAFDDALEAFFEKKLMLERKYAKTEKSPIIRPVFKSPGETRKITKYRNGSEGQETPKDRKSRGRSRKSAANRRKSIDLDDIEGIFGMAEEEPSHAMDDRQTTPARQKVLWSADHSS